MIQGGGAVRADLLAPWNMTSLAHALLYKKQERKGAEKSEERNKENNLKFASRRISVKIQKRCGMSAEFTQP